MDRDNASSDLMTNKGAIDLHDCPDLVGLSYLPQKRQFSMDFDIFQNRKKGSLQLGDATLRHFRLDFVDVSIFEVKTFAPGTPNSAHGNLNFFTFSEKGGEKRFEMKFFGGMVIEVGFKDMEVWYE